MPASQHPTPNSLSPFDKSRCIASLSNAMVVITIPCSLLFTGIGLYAWRREKPMRFWSGSSVREEEITDVKAYNRGNGIMWICYSAVFWISTIMGIWNVSAAGIVLTVGCLGGIPLLVITYNRIYRKYKRRGI